MNNRYQKHLALNLQGREIGTQYRRHTSNQNAYRHHYQLTSAFIPDSLVPINLDDAQERNSELPPFSSLAKCLGFSPNGKYLVFHAHSRHTISVLKYSGIEGANTSRSPIHPPDVFPLTKTFKLSTFTRQDVGQAAEQDVGQTAGLPMEQDGSQGAASQQPAEEHGYQYTPIIASWWTDDSSTLVIQISMNGNDDGGGEGPIEDPPSPSIRHDRTDQEVVHQYFEESFPPNENKKSVSTGCIADPSQPSTSNGPSIAEQLRLLLKSSQNGRANTTTAKDLKSSRFPDADLFRLKTREHQIPPYFDPSEIVNPTTIAFIAFNIEEETMRPLFFKSITNNFHCHMRDRILSVAHTDTLIESYKLVKNDGWEENTRFDLSTRKSTTVRLNYRTGTMPKQPSRLKNVKFGHVFDDLYDSKEFNSPIQQNVAVLLQRKLRKWILQHNEFRNHTLTVTRLHMVTDNLLAISVKYSHQEHPSIQLGIIVSLRTNSLTLYPNYHVFLKLLFRYHLPGMLPRHWTYLNPTPANEQQWFRRAFIDVSDARQLDNLQRLSEIYDLLADNWSNVKSTSNPLTDSAFYHVDVNHFMGKFIFANRTQVSLTDNIGLYDKIHMEQFYHPTDPFILVQNGYNWKIAYHREPPESSDDLNNN